MPIWMVPLCHACQVAQTEDFSVGVSVATQQYIWLGKSLRKTVLPEASVLFLAMGAQGNGRLSDRGVDSTTGIFGAGEPAIVTDMRAQVMWGFGVAFCTETPAVELLQPIGTEGTLRPAHAPRKATTTKAPKKRAGDE